MTSTMQAIVQHGYGDPERVLRLEEVPRPDPGPDEVLVRVRASSVNTPDWLTATGEPWVLRLQNGLRRPRTPIRGTDVAGVVEQVGRDVDDLAVGDEVFGSAWADGLASPGAFCEYAVVPVTQLAHRPQGVPWTDAAVSVMSGLTALIGVRDVAAVEPGMAVLLNGASGGVGTFMVQLAATAGAEVTGVCSDRNADLVRGLGATRVVDHTQTDVRTVEHRFDVVFDNVLNHPGPDMARLLTTDGVLVPNSVGQGHPLWRGLPRMARSVLLGRGATDVRTISCEMTRPRLAAMAKLLGSGEVEPVVGRTYALADAPAAVAHMAGHHARGNVAITVP